MKATVDKKELLTRLDWARRVSPQSSTLAMGTDLDVLTIQIGGHNDFHLTGMVADVEMDGAVSINLDDTKDLNELKGSTVRVETHDTNMIFLTDESSIIIACEPTSLRQSPRLEILGKVDPKTLATAMTPLKENVCRKSEKGSEGLLEASMRLARDSMTILATNRFAAWNAVVPVTGAALEKPMEGEFMVLPWASTTALLKAPAHIIRAGNMYGVKDDDTMSLFPLNAPNESGKLNRVFARMRDDYGPRAPLVFNKKQLVDAITSLKKSKPYTRIEFLDSQKALLSSFSLGDDEEAPRTISFSIDYEGTPSIESMIISPTNLLKTLKGAQGQKVAVYLPSSPALPIGIAESPDSKVYTDSLGLTMPVTLPQG